MFKILLSTILVTLTLAGTYAGPFVRRDVNQTAVDEAKANNEVAVLTVKSNNNQWVVTNAAAGVSTNLQECSSDQIPDSSVSTGDDFVAFFFDPTVSANNSCWFYDSSVFNYDAVVNQAISTPVTQDALVSDTSKTVVCTDVDESQLPVCFDLTGTKFTFAKYYTNAQLLNNAAPADVGTQYTTSSDLADIINNGEPLPSGSSDYPEVAAFLQNDTSVYEVVFFNSSDNYIIGTSQDITFSVPYAIGTSFYNFSLALWLTIGSQTGSESLKIQDIASNITNVDAVNNTQLSWTVNVTTSVLNVTNTTDTNATQTNYFLAVYGYRSFSGPNGFTGLPWDPVYFGIYENVYSS